MSTPASVAPAADPARGRGALGLTIGGLLLIAVVVMQVTGVLGGAWKLLALLAGIALLAGHAKPPALALPPSAVLWTTAWFGLLTGWTEAAHGAVLRYGFGMVVKLPESFVWATPLADLGLFVGIGVLLAALAWLSPASVTLGTVALLGGGMLGWSHAALHPLATWAAAALALGCGVQAARMVGGVPERALAVMRTSAVPMLLLVPALFVAEQWLHRDREPAAKAAANEPNVLLLVLDTARADHTGFGGYARNTTPHLDRLAAEGTVFEHAIATTSWTLPSHASLFTGRYANQTTADWEQPMDREPTTLAEVFDRRGYDTAGFVGNIRYCSSEYGIDRGFRRYEDYLLEPVVIAYCSAIVRELMTAVVGQPFHSVVRNDAATVTDRFLGWLDERDSERPWFAFLNYYDLHQHCDPPEAYRTRFGPVMADAGEWNAHRPEDGPVMQRFRNGYDACLAYIDDEIDRLVTTLAERGALDDTVLVLTGDHGEQFGEHRLSGHGNSLYLPLLHVPLFVRAPNRVPAGKRVAAWVSSRDLPATILDLTGAVVEGWPGRSLRPLLNEGSVPTPWSPICAAVSEVDNAPAFLPVARGDMASVIEGGRQYIRNGDGSEELYDLAADPDQHHDLIAASHDWHVVDGVMRCAACGVTFDPDHWRMRRCPQNITLQVPALPASAQSADR